MIGLSDTIHHILRYSSTPNLPFIFSVLTPVMLSVEFTGDSRVCYRCGKKWVDDTLGQVGWGKAKSAATRKAEEVCSECLSYCYTKSQREYQGFSSSLASYKLNTYLGQLAETSRAPTPSAATSNHSEQTKKLVSNSQRGVGACLAEHKS